MTQSEPERCGGPGNKVIYTREEAKAELTRRVKGRRARVGQGSAHPCAWCFGAHWHISSSNNKRRHK